MKMTLPMFLSAALVIGCATPVMVRPLAAQSSYPQSDADQDRDRNTEAYRDGYTAGQADGQRGTRIDRPSDRWTSSDDRRAYMAGYDAGFRNGGGMSSAPGASLGHGENQAYQFGYQDGLANGRKDRDKGDKFKPTKGEMYEHGDHGWTSEFSDKEHFKQLYRQGYVKGYGDGYNGTGPR